MPQSQAAQSLSPPGAPGAIGGAFGGRVLLATVSAGVLCATHPRPGSVDAKLTGSVVASASPVFRGS